MTVFVLNTDNRLYPVSDRVTQQEPEDAHLLSQSEATAQLNHQAHSVVLRREKYGVVGYCACQHCQSSPAPVVLTAVVYMNRLDGGRDVLYFCDQECPYFKDALQKAKNIRLRIQEQEEQRQKDGALGRRQAAIAQMNKPAPGSPEALQERKKREAERHQRQQARGRGKTGKKK